jgi:hypothetical protein
MKTTFTLGLLLIAIAMEAQVGIGTTDPKAMLDVVSVSEGFLIPRMTAEQAESIAEPDIGELVYALTDDGDEINDLGFWYYNGASWQPLSDDLPPHDNLYTMDGSLEANRVVNMNGQTLQFDADKLSIDAVSQRVGVGESAPSATVDVNGNLRVRNLTAGNVVALADGTLAIGPKIAYGTVKESLRTTDHNGWYKLDGRLVSTLPAAAQANAATVGLTGSLVDTSNRLMKQGTPFTTGGVDTVTLTQANLPVYNMTGTTNTAGAHTHAESYAGHVMTYAATGNAFVMQTGGPITGTTTVATTVAGAHTHAGTVNSGGSALPIDVLPQSMSYSYFIYLGQ